MYKKPAIKVIDSQGQELATFNISEREQAFTYAEQMEALGIEVTISEPSLPESLIISLGASESDTEALKKEIEQEIESHDDCCSESTTLH